MKWSAFCERCTGGKCHPDELPSATSPNGIQCTACEARHVQGHVCKTCNGRGSIEITRCPHELVPGEIWELFRAADFARRGVLAVAGGYLDQTAASAAGIRAVWAEESRYRAKAGYKD